MPKFKTHEEFLDDIKDRPITVLGIYKHSKEKVLLRCDIDGHEWEARPNGILNGRGCPICGAIAGVINRKRYNDIISDHGTYLEIDISSPTHPKARMLIDKSDWNMLLSLGIGRVHAAKTGEDSGPYAHCHLNGKTKAIHRLIMPEFQYLDHADGDELNNRRSNLRECTPSQNQWNTGLQSNNTSGFKGVHLVKGKWVANIGLYGKKIRIGTFSTPEEAHQAYSDAAIKYHGEFARVE